MGQSPSQIEHEIATKRVGLEIHVRELESKLEEATDWRTYVRRKPLGIAAGAFSLGLLVALITGKR